MVEVSEVLSHLDGNGFTGYEIAEVAVRLAQFSKLKKELEGSLDCLFDENEIEQLFGRISTEHTNGKVVNDSLNLLSPRQREVYVLHVVENKSKAMIAKELNLSFSAIKGMLSRAKSKMKDIEIESVIAPTPVIWDLLISNTDDLTRMEREDCVLHFVKGKSMARIAKEREVHKSSVALSIHHAKSKFNTSVLYK